MPNKLSSLSGDLLILVAMGLFGSYPLFLRLFPDIPTVTFIFAFQIIGGASFFFLKRKGKRKRLSAHTKLLLLALAVAAISNDLLYFAAFRNTSVANAAIGHQSVSIFLLLLAPLLLHEKTRRNELISLVPSLIGIVLLYANGVDFDSAKDILGTTLGILSGLFYALLIVLYRIIPAKADLDIRTVNFWRYIISATLLLPFIPLFRLNTVQSNDMLPLVAFGLLFAVLASGIHTFGISRARSLHASIIGKTEPVFAILYAFLILHERPALSTVIGGILIVGSSIWLASSTARQQLSPAEQLLSD